MGEIPTTFITTLYHKDCYATNVLTYMHVRTRPHTHTNTSFIIGKIYANGIFTHFWQI